jgi:DNA-binding MarR family transcriptional regulator
MLPTAFRRETIDVAHACLCLHAQPAARVLARRFDEVFRPLELVNGQFTLLTALAKPLERRGLIEVLTDLTDRRKRRPRLTARGHALLGRAYTLRRNAHTEIEQRIGSADALRRGLRRVVHVTAAIDRAFVEPLSPALLTVSGETPKLPAATLHAARAVRFARRPDSGINPSGALAGAKHRIALPYRPSTATATRTAS